MGSEILIWINKYFIFRGGGIIKLYCYYRNNNISVNNNKDNGNDYNNNNILYVW